MIHTTYIGIGSNLDNPRRQVANAVTALGLLPATHLAGRSPWYASKAVGPGRQPDYINGVVKLETSLEVEALLDALQAIEHAQGRLRTERWGPRTLDLDILLYDDLQINTTRLQIPHPELDHRSFVLYPLADIAPDLKLPGTGESLSNLLAKGPPDGIVRLAGEGGDNPNF